VIEAKYAYRCDGRGQGPFGRCYATTPWFRTAEEAAASPARQGWTIAPDGRASCPECSRATRAA
jgi:hypothetical protein